MKTSKSSSDEQKGDLESMHTDTVSLKLQKSIESDRPILIRSIVPEDLMQKESPKNAKVIRFIIVVFCFTLLLLGRFSVPSNEPDCIVDKMQDWLFKINQYILNNEALRNTLQIICSGFMDIMAAGTFLYWFARGTNCRLVFSLIVFFFIRAIIQAIWFSPFPAGFWWYDPGFPSMVVPYGRGSDFFFSGHIGCVTICALEWKKNGYPRIATGLIIGAVYTGFILLAYRVHYSIDIFTGVTFAHYVFLLVDMYKESIDNFFIGIYYRGKKLFLKSMFALTNAKDGEKDGL